jgi:hypothetical protein
MHVTEKISLQMKRPFVSTECTYVQKIELKINEHTKSTDIVVSFIYDHEIFLLTLLFENVSKFIMERDSPGFNLGELLFYDEEDGTSLCIGDELGGFSIVCNNVQFISIEEMNQAWVSFIRDLY